MYPVNRGVPANRANHASLLLQIFEMIDANGNRIISPREYKVFFRAYGLSDEVRIRPGMAKSLCEIHYAIKYENNQ